MVRGLCSVSYQGYIHGIIVIALLYYDYILTFGMEVEYIWRQRFRFSTVLYICCRYALVANVIYLFAASDEIKIKVFFMAVNFAD